MKDKKQKICEEFMEFSCVTPHTVTGAAIAEKVELYGFDFEIYMTMVL